MAIEPYRPLGATGSATAAAVFASPLPEKACVDPVTDDSRREIFSAADARHGRWEREQRYKPLDEHHVG